MYQTDWLSRLSPDSRRFYDTETSEASRELFSDETMLLPHIVLDTVIEEVMTTLSNKGLPTEALHEGLYRNEDVERYIWNRTVLAYNNNAQWHQQMSAEDPRPAYYAFVKHWFSEILKAASPQAYEAAKTYLQGCEQRPFNTRNSLS